MAKKEVQTALKKGKAQFNLIGKIHKINDYTFKIDNEYDSGWVDSTANIGVDCGNGNVVYAELRGGYHTINDSVLYVHGIKEDANGKKTEDYENRFTIAWEDRFDEDILETVADSCFVTLGIEKDAKGKTFVKKFLSAYDAVEYLQEHLTEDMTVNVKGKISYSGEERTYIKKEITSIFLSKIEEKDGFDPAVDFKATFTQTILLDSASIGKLDKEKNTIDISAFVVDYVGNVMNDSEKIAIKKNVVFPFNFEFANEKPEMTAKILQKFFKVSKKTDVYEIAVEGNIVEGQAIVEVSEDDIADDIKELIEMGLYTKEEAQAKYAVGNTKRERRMIITRPFITYVGDGDDRKPTIALDTTKYKETDKVFLTQLLAEVGVETKSEKTETITETFDDVSDDELDDFLNSL